MEQKNNIEYLRKRLMTLKSKEYIVLRQKTIKYIWPIASAFFMIYILIYFFVSKDYFSGWILLIDFIFFVVTIGVYLKTKNTVLIGNALASLGIPAILPWLVTGGPSGVGLWGSLVYVTWAFIVTDIKSAMFWLSLHLVLSVVIVILASKGILTIAYSGSVLYNLLFAYLISILYVFFLVKVLEYYLQLSQKKEDELTEVNKNLISINTELEQFIYAASHDLQEPIRIVNSYLQLIERKYKDKLDNEANDFINYAVDGGNKMKALILSLLEYSGISKIRPWEYIDMNNLIKEVLKDMTNQIKDNETNITIAPLPVIYADKVLIAQLFENLISNAVKFKKAGPSEITISVNKKEDEYVFSIKDSGIGIQKEYADKIFTIFQHLNSQHKYPGTGIGLAICKKIVEKHGGKIWFESEFGKGSTFYFTLNAKTERKNEILSN